MQVVRIGQLVVLINYYLQSNSLASFVFTETKSLIYVTKRVNFSLFQGNMLLLPKILLLFYCPVFCAHPVSKQLRNYAKSQLFLSIIQ